MAEYTKSAALNMMAPETLRKNNDIYKKSGWKAYVQANLDMLLKEKRPSMSPFFIASFYARLGQKDEALSWLEKGYEERDFRMTLLSVAFEFDSFRSDPRFVELVRQMGLPE